MTPPRAQLATTVTLLRLRGRILVSLVGTFWLAATGAAGLLAGGAAADQPSSSSASAPVANPHISRDLCQLCHVGTTKPTAAPEGNVDRVCLGCHDGEQAKSEPHPIGVAATGRGTSIPANWPTSDGKLTCLTCHDVRPWCRGESGTAFRSQNLLRAATPTDSRGKGIAASQSFCASCHDPGLYVRSNPHRMRTEAGEVLPGVCHVCHEVRFDIEGALIQGHRAGNPRLRADEKTLCGSCHASHGDYFEPGHIGATASPAVLAALARPAGTGWETLATLLPLTKEGVVTCSTCHNPHEQGLFTAETELACGALHMSGSSRGSILRLPRGELCIACHAP